MTMVAGCRGHHDAEQARAPVLPRHYGAVDSAGVDPKTHRPLRNRAADYGRGPALVYPAMPGAHSWQPMSYSPASGLVYIPVIDAPMVYIETSRRRAGFIEGTFTVAGVPPEAYDPKAMASLFGALPPLQERPPQARGLCIRPVYCAPSIPSQGASCGSGPATACGMAVYCPRLEISCFAAMPPDS